MEQRGTAWTGQGTGYFREALHLPPQVFPSTLTAQLEARAVLVGADTAAASGGGGLRLWQRRMGFI